jgi:hypothetical protein
MHKDGLSLRGSVVNGREPAGGISRRQKETRRPLGRRGVCCAFTNSTANEMTLRVVI